jgi:hypothetical protein
MLLPLLVFICVHRQVPVVFLATLNATAQSRVNSPNAVGRSFLTLTLIQTSEGRKL